MARERNTKLAALIAETGWSQAQVAARFVRVALEADVREWAGATRSHVSQWVLGTQPSGRAPAILCETLSRGLKRPVTLTDVGLTGPDPAAATAPDWRVDTLAALNDLGRQELDMERRRVLGTAAYSVAGLALPSQQWWQQATQRATARDTTTGRAVGSSDVDAIQEMGNFFSRRDQRHGGGHGRAAVVAYLTSDVAECLNGSCTSEQTRRRLYSAAGELAYLSGWMAFDDSQHAIAQRYFTLAVKLAAEAEDPALAAHILRAMAHQAVDLGHPQQALDLAAASVDGSRYRFAVPREKALLGVVHARALAAAGRKREASAALLRAEDDLAAAHDGIQDPGRVFFFGEASLAHETACTLRDLGDLAGAEKEFRRSVRTRKAAAFSRTHAVTLGYLGAIEASRGNVEAACSTWSRALDAMSGVQSGRARQTVLTMRRVVSPFRNRGIGAVAELDTRTASLLRTSP
ncbi:Tat pathway signal protein [Streptomyces sp. MNU89]|uniref:Tat pathway signal protein n=1 Tax=Streptomyces sp. MNU89 TaxID=2560025 RepID=UPI001E2FA059|nr:Tat pathway signal protein [Streptomyces sp. MNU89]MCC9738500.1 Tat pathway signal protein [Streptomyces sp. MNU89]